MSLPRRDGRPAHERFLTNRAERLGRQLAWADLMRGERGDAVRAARARLEPEERIKRRRACNRDYMRRPEVRVAAKVARELRPKEAGR